MPDVLIQIDFYYSPYCEHCAGSREVVRHIAKSMPGVFLCERNVLEYIEQAAARGVRATPSIALNGKLVVSGAVTARQLRDRLRTEIKNALHDR